MPTHQTTRYTCQWGLYICLVLALSACGGGNSNKPSNVNADTVAPPQPVVDASQPLVSIDLAQIKARGKLVALTTYSSTSYFIYKGKPMGYEYELLNRLSQSLGVDLEVRLVSNLDSMFYLLNMGQGDIVAHGLTVTKARKEIVNFTKAHSNTYQVLVQRKPDNWRQLKLHQIEKRLVRNPVSLIGKTVHVREKSSYYQRLLNLSEELGDDIVIAPAPGSLTTDEIIERVANGTYEYTLADQHLAEINQTYHANIDIGTPMSLETRIAWAVRKNAPDLLQAVNDWVTAMRRQNDYYVIYNKYFKNKRAFLTRAKSDYFSLRGGKISQYDDQLRAAADSIGWDWRLLAAQVYQESRFEHDITSWAGARGLMQVMPATAKQYGISELFNAQQNITAGTKYLNWLQGLWQNIPDSTQRVKFILASYNAGPGHIQDAQRLAKKHGKDPNIWDGHVAEYVLLKSRPQYFNDPVVKYGYVRGTEPYKYVNEILARYATYQQMIART